MRRASPLFSLFLTFVLVAGSLTMAVARGHMAASSQLVICSGYGVITVTLDARGNPVQSVHACPDCLAANISGLLPASLVVMSPTNSRRVALLLATVAPHGQTPPNASARGPPQTV